jgi:FtsP/CotA-like multicopper oxidase with cupredoxin domain
MSIIQSRRQFLATAASATALGGLSTLIPAPARRALAASPAPTRLIVERRILEVLGKPASVFGIRQPDGTQGLFLDPGQRFLVELENRSGEDTAVHWHGMTPPYVQDGVTDDNRPLVKAGAIQAYDFEPRPGTHWMHSHHGLQEQLLMAAPLVVRSTADLSADAREVTVLLHDFTFTRLCAFLAFRLWRQAVENVGFGGLAQDIPPCPGPGFWAHQMDRNVGAGLTKPHKLLKSNDSTYDRMRKVELRTE